MAKKRMMLFFGSFNPIHRGHMALAEYAIEHDLCDEVAMIISPQNPFKQGQALASEMDRYAMVEIACKNCRFPENISPSVIEFLLEKPSYTVNTLRHLSENYGHAMQFSILMGTDLINQLPQWYCASEIIDNYDIYVYPRAGVEMNYSTPRTTFLADAPQYAHSSTAVREALQQSGEITTMVDAEVAQYIKEHKVWGSAMPTATPKKNIN